MAKFNEGDRVRITQITDIDAAYDAPDRVHTDPADEMTMDWQDPPQTLIGQVGVIKEAALNDYYDCLVQFSWNDERESCAMKEDDLKLVEGEEDNG